MNDVANKLSDRPHLAAPTPLGDRPHLAAPTPLGDRPPDTFWDVAH
ncbi:hypothetical protein P7L53_16340 [Thermoleptolyngbya sichuanensis XZ-Cy5]|nr:hypothetical protein [Thermoleptolyngbya sichuanensis]MDG2617812.1 hypothetical protein [Thermoleptolyngbya sichuanensis XZ-Cy5]